MLQFPDSDDMESPKYLSIDLYICVSYIEWPTINCIHVGTLSTLIYMSSCISGALGSFADKISTCAADMEYVNYM
jgi:hypothetical protein